MHPGGNSGICECSQALEQSLLNERENGLKEVRACTAAAEVAVTVANACAAGVNEVDPQAAVTSSKMKVGETNGRGRAEGEGISSGNVVRTRVQQYIIYIESYRLISK